jgi:hypothetical protein
MLFARLFLALMLVGLIAAGCRPDDPYEPADPADPEPAPAGELVPPAPGPSSTPRLDADAILDSVTVEQPVTRQPGEVARLDPDNVVAISVDGPGVSYSIERLPEPRVVRGRDGPAPSEGAIDALLARYAPLDGQEVLTQVSAHDVRSRPSHRVIFHMEDGSALTVAFVRRGAYVAAASRDSGPVYRLAAGALPALVPPLDDLR